MLNKLTESELHIINSLDRYTLEVIAIKVLSLFFSEFGESTMVRHSYLS